MSRIFVFVSSTWTDLQSERSAVNAALREMTGFSPVSMEYFGSRDESTREVSVQEVDRSDVFVMILGGRWGSGIVELEYRRARERGLSCLIYAFASSRIRKQEKDPQLRERLASFQAELSAVHTVSTFESGADLAEKVKVDLERWFARSGRDLAGDDIAVPDQKLRLATGGAGGSAIFSKQPPPPEPQLRPLPLAPSLRQKPNFLDRETERADALRAIESGVIVEVQGASGAGKTSLLRYLAYCPSGAPDGVVYIGNAGQQPLADLWQQIFEEFYETGKRWRVTLPRLRSLLKDRRALLILDDVTLTAKELTEVTNLAPRGRFLFASGKKLLAGESKGVALGGLPIAEAQELVTEDVGIHYGGDEVSAFAELHQLLAGHPGHLLRAAHAAHAKQLTLRQLLTELPSDDAGSAIEWLSVAERPDSEHRILASIAALDPAGATASVLKAISGEGPIEPALESLMGSRLIEEHEGRYRLTGVSASLLAARWNLDAQRERAAEHLAAMAETVDVQRTVQEIESIHLLLEWTSRSGRLAVTKRLARAAEKAMALAGRWEVWGQALEHLLKAARATSDRNSEAHALHQLGSRAICLGDGVAGRRLLKDALKLREASNDFAAVSVTRHNLGMSVMRRVWPPWIGRIAATGLVALLLPFVSRMILDQASPPPPTPPAPRVTFSPAIAYLTAPASGAAGDPVRISMTNRRRETLAVGAVETNDASFSIQGGDCENQSLPYLGSCELVVVFAPKAGKATAVLRVSDRGRHPVATLPLAGAIAKPPAEALVVFDPAALGFGSRYAGQAESRVLTLRNAGDAPMRVLRLRRGGVHASDFTVTQNGCGTELAPGRSCAVSVRFVPLHAGARHGTLEIAGSAPGSPWSVPLNGTGLALPAPTIEPVSLNFGGVDHGMPVAPRRVIVRNNGPAPLRLRDIRRSPEFPVARTNCHLPVPAGGSCFFDVIVVARARGNRIGEIVFQENSVAGRGRIALEAVCRAPRIQFDPEPLSFSGQRQSERKTVKVTNTGDAPLRVSGVHIVPEIPNERQVYTIEGNNCENGMIGIKRSCEIRVRFNVKGSIAGAQDFRARVRMMSNTLP